MSATAGARPEVDLAALVLRGDVQAVATACDAGTAVTDRAALVATCKQIISRGPWLVGGHTPDQMEAAAIAFTAHASVAELRPMRTAWLLPRDHELTRRVVAARDEAFRDAWVEKGFDNLDARAVRIGRRLIADGAAHKPDSDAYTLALVSHPGSFDLSAGLDGWRRTTVIEALRRNPDLLVDDVWRLFEVEGAGENSLAAYDKYCRKENWRAALVELGSDGTLDRERLLDASLDALQRGFSQFRAQWFSAFHEALRPTPAERRQRASTYLALAASPIGPTASMALKALAQIQNAGGLDPAQVVSQIGPALLTPSKGAALQALGLLSHAGEADPALRLDAAAGTVSALGHNAPDVQKAAAAQLRSWFPTAPDSLAASVRAVTPGCHPSVRSDLATWLSDGAGASESRPTPSARASRPTHREPSDLRPVSDLDDLLERTAASIEAPGSPDELEEVVTAIAAAGHGAVAGLRSAITLARRAAVVWRTASPTQQLLARLVIAWVAPDDTATEPHRRLGTHALDDLLCDRVEEATERVRRGEPFVPIAAPTHRTGMIDPVVLAERVRAAGDAADPAELTAALLRLRPDRDRLGEARRMLPADDAVAQWFEQWAEQCERDATRPSSWSCLTRTTRGYTFRELHVGGLGTLTPPSWPLPVALGSARSRRFASDPAGVAWMGSLIPGLPASWARLAASTIGPTIGIRDVAHGDPAFLERLFDQEVHLGDDANLLLALALNDQRAAVRTVAVDVTLAALDDGRLDPRGLGVQIGRLASNGLVTPSRWVRSLADVAGATCDHRAAVEQVLEQAFAIADPPKPQDLLGLLELFETLALDSGGTLTNAAARATLSRIAGTSKTAKAAARVLALEAG